jgi:alpha-tubulin suppressor-like RCC1 family protein
MSISLVSNVTVTGNLSVNSEITGAIQTSNGFDVLTTNLDIPTYPKAIMSSCGSNYTAIVMNDGTVRVCGNNIGGQLGVNNRVNRSTVVSVLGISSQAIAVACGAAHTAILMNDGTVRVCGLNQFGQLGQNNTITRSTVVSVLGISSQAIAVAGGRYHTAILMNDGTVRVTGLNNRGQLGQNDLVNRSTAVSVLGISSQAIAVACGFYQTAILMNDGTVRICGRNDLGQLGQNDTVTRSTVVSVLGISSQAIAVSCGANHTAILMNDGTVRVTGSNFGQLGQNDLVNRITVVSVLGVPSQAIAVACGADHTVILMNDGTVRLCGQNQVGQLGQNDTVTRSTVVSVLGISSQAIAVVGGSFHTTILMNDGTVRVCGQNSNGQLGQNDLVSRSTVVPVLGISSSPNDSAIAIASSTRFTTAIVMNDGTVRLCGQNQFGQLGQNDAVSRSTVVPVLGISSQAIAVTTGGYHTAILMNDGTVRVVGYNNSGQLGQNNVANKSTVVSVIGISSQAIAVASSWFNTAILMNNGTVRVCGRNAEGQLGQNDTLTRSTVVSVLGISSQAIAVAVGRYHTAILMNDGTVRVCGRNNNGQLGQNDLITRSTVVSVLGISSQAIAVACGQSHTAILMSDGTVRVCGRNAEGQLGQNNTLTRSTVVSVLGISSQAIAVSCGQYHTAILMNDGTVRVCGRNTDGQLGVNNTVNRSTVVSVLGISSQAIAVAGSRYHTVILMNDGTVRVCGNNNNGQLGQNDLVNRSTVIPILGVQPLYLNLKQCYTRGSNNLRQIAVSIGLGHTAILMNNGTVRVTGLNNLGQLGQNDAVSRSTVVSVLGISSQAIAVACGRNHTAILMNDGTVRVCGQNSFAQLGINNVIGRSTPVSVLGISSQAIAVACGQSHTAILMNDGTVRVCGNNINGQLGQNDTVSRSTVVSVLGISSQAIAVACGQYHTAILMNDGTVRVCGLNNNGQLGVNNTVNRSTVVSVVGISSQAIAVACGYFHTAILMNDGTVRVCGLNNNGQLGQNNTLSRSTVVSVLGISSQAIAVACGVFHTTILMNDGTVRGTGRNINGQMGVNNTVNRSTVVSVLGISSQAIAIGSCQYQTAILLNDGTVRVCGNNNNGQLGQNDTLTRSTVVSVLGMFGSYLNMNALALSVVNPSPSLQLDLSTDNARKLSSSTWFTGSDERIKSDIQTANLARCSEIIDSLDLKYFEWTPDIQTNDRHSLGWIAQDVAKFFPNSVKTAPAHGIEDFQNLNSDQLIKVMYGSLKNMIQKTYPPTEVVNELSIQEVNLPESAPATTDPQTN